MNQKIYGMDGLALQLEQIKQLKTPFDGGDGGGYDVSMEARVVKLEEFAVDTRDRLTRIETRLDQTATKTDLHEAINAQIKWMVGVAVVLGGTFLTIITFVLNNAIPKVPSASAAQQSPIIITVPATSQAPTALQPPTKLGK